MNSHIFYYIILDEEEKSLDDALLEQCKHSSVKEICHFITNNFSDKNIHNLYGKLYVCCEYENFDTAEYILNFYKSRESINIGDILWESINRGDCELAKFMITINIEIFDEVLCNSLLETFSGEKGNLDMIRFLLQKYGNKIRGCKRNKECGILNFASFCEIAMNCGNMEIFKFLCKKFNRKEVGLFFKKISIGDGKNQDYLSYLRIFTKTHVRHVSRDRLYVYCTNAHIYGNKTFLNYIKGKYLNKERDAFFYFTRNNLFLAQMNEKPTVDRKNFIKFGEYEIFYKNPPSERDKGKFMVAFEKHMSSFRVKSAASHKL